MELVEFLIFLALNIFLAVLALTKKAGLPSVIGLIICLFVLPFARSGIVLDRIVVVNSTTGIPTYYTITSDTTMTMLIFIMLAILHFLIVIGVLKDVW